MLHFRVLVCILCVNSIRHLCCRCMRVNRTTFLPGSISALVKLQFTSVYCVEAGDNCDWSVTLVPTIGVGPLPLELIKTHVMITVWSWKGHVHQEEQKYWHITWWSPSEAERVTCNKKGGRGYVPQAEWLVLIESRASCNKHGCHLWPEQDSI